MGNRARQPNARELFRTAIIAIALVVLLDERSHYDKNAKDANDCGRESFLNEGRCHSAADYILTEGWWNLDGSIERFEHEPWSQKKISG